jgi:hypothetical protein
VKIEERNGKLFVLGCRCVKGDYRGISTFDQKCAWLGGAWKHFKISRGTPIPPNLAVTQDSDLRHKANHFTIAPKDDMPLDLFLQSLKPLADAAKEE